MHEAGRDAGVVLGNQDIACYPGTSLRICASRSLLENGFVT